MRVRKSRLDAIIKEVNDQHYQQIIDDIIVRFYEKAEEYEQYQPLALDGEITNYEMDIIARFNPPEFLPIKTSSRPELELSDEQVEALEQWLEGRVDEVFVKRIRESLESSLRDTVKDQIQSIRDERKEVQKKIQSSDDPDEKRDLEARLKELSAAESELSSTDVEDPEEVATGSSMTTVEGTMRMSTLRGLIQESMEELKNLKPI